MDIGRFLRLRNQAQEALAATPPEQGSAWRGLVETYTQLRAEVADAVDEDLRAELERLFRSTIDTEPAEGTVRRDPTVLLRQQNVASDARTRIAGLAGWSTASSKRRSSTPAYRRRLTPMPGSV
jgi:uncharacterized protein (DUF1684 family)